MANKKQEEKLTYEPPKIDIVTFELEDSIASSGDYGSNAVCSEGIWGGEE